MKHTRKNSTSILEAVEDIQKKTRKRAGKRTEKRWDTCARQFAKTLMGSYPDLMFWQNTPPDSEDLPKGKADLVPEDVRQVWPCPVKTRGHMIGSWLLDVYAGSRKAVQFGNQWDEPYDFHYEAAFQQASNAVSPDTNARKLQSQLVSETGELTLVRQFLINQ